MERREASFEAEFPDMLRVALGMARRILSDNELAAEDAAAEAMARTYTAWGKLADREYRLAWVARVAANLALDTRRRRTIFTEVAPSRGHEEQVTTRVVVRDALQRLSRRQREAVALCWLANFSEAEAAGALNVSAGTIKTHLHRGMAALRSTLDAKESARVLP